MLYKIQYKKNKKLNLNKKKKYNIYNKRKTYGKVTAWNGMYKDKNRLKKSFFT